MQAMNKSYYMTEECGVKRYMGVFNRFQYRTFLYALLSIGETLFYAFYRFTINLLNGFSFLQRHIRSQNSIINNYNGIPFTLSEQKFWPFLAM